MVIKHKYVIYMLLLLIVSCKKENKAISANRTPLTNIEISLPDSITTNKIVYGEITYSSVFDTIILKENERRYIFLYLTKSKKISENFENFQKMELDTFVRLDNHIIPIYDIEFAYKGKMFLDGYVIDQVFLDSNTEIGKVNISTLETKITHPITIN